MCGAARCKWLAVIDPNLYLSTFVVVVSYEMEVFILFNFVHLDIVFWNGQKFYYTKVGFIREVILVFVCCWIVMLCVCLSVFMWDVYIIFMRLVKFSISLYEVGCGWGFMRLRRLRFNYIISYKFIKYVYFSSMVNCSDRYIYIYIWFK